MPAHKLFKKSPPKNKKIKIPSNTLWLFILLLLIFTIILVYLNRSYSYFFDNIGAHKLPSPFINKEYLINQKSGSEFIKYAAVGDSLTAGVGSSDLEQTFSYQLAEKIAPQKTVLLRNEGYPAAKAHDLLSKIDDIDKFDPDLITILIGINDAFNRTPIQEYRKDLNTILMKLKKDNRDIYILTIPYLGSKKSVYFPFNLLYDLQLNRYNLVIKDLAQTHNIKLIDLYTLSHQSFTTDESLYSKDLFHPSEKGYILISDFLFTEVKRSETTPTKEW